MTNPKCAVCGHVNLVGAAVCEMCDANLFEPGAADDARTRGVNSEASGSYAGDFGAGGGGFNSYGDEPRDGAPPDEIPSPQFKGAGDVMSPTLAIYRKHFTLVGALVAVTTLPVALLQYGVIRGMAASLRDGGVEQGGIIALGVAIPLLVALLSFLGTTVLSGSLVSAVVEIQRTGAAAVGESLRRGLRLLPKVFVVTLLYTIITAVGYLLLIVPGVIFSLMYAVAVPVAVVENLGPFESLKRSARLTEGHRGLIFLTYFLWGLLIIVLNMVVSGSFAFAGAEMSLAALLVQSLVGGMLNSSATVLTVFIYLGILHERRHGFETHTFTPGPAAAAR